jgi:uncharacterized protein YciI
MRSARRIPLLVFVSLVFLAAGGLPAEEAAPAVKSKTAVGRVVPVGCPHDAAACSALLGEHRGDSLALEAGNGEIFILHGVDAAEWEKLLARAGSPVAVTGRFAWRGKLRTLGVDDVRPASAEEAREAKTADPEYEMKLYYMTFLKPGPKQKTFSEAEVQELMKGHFGHITTQAAAGNLLIAGPFGEQEPVRRYSGIYLYTVDSLEEAEALTRLDPTIGAGYFVSETIPWYGPASLGY